MSDVTKYVPYLGAVAAAGLGSLYVLRKLGAFTSPGRPQFPPKPIRECGRDYPKDTIILHTMLRGPYAPSLANMALKVETYLRATGVPYEPHLSPLNIVHGPKKKIPWIECNGQEVADSEFIIDFINKEFKVDLDQNLSPLQKAQSRAIQKWVDEFTYWLIVYSRWYTFFDDWFPQTLRQMGSVDKGAFRKMVETMGYHQGVGRHTQEELNKFLEDDLIALSELLGDNDYFMGGSNPTRVDCAVFGQLTQLRWHTPDSFPGKKTHKREIQEIGCILFADKGQILAGLGRVL